MPASPKAFSLDQQRELFLWKFKDVSRSDVNDLFKDFKRHDVRSKGELDEHEAMMLLESRNAVKTATELREMLASMDKTHNHHLSFIEWCCAHYNKSYEELNNFSDEAAREEAMAEAMAAGEEAKRAEEEIERAKQQKELQASLRAAALERESKMTGVAGMRAFFFRRVESAADVSKTNEQTIKEEAARRKALRDAKAKVASAAQNANKTYSAEDVAREVAEQTKRQAAAEAEALKKKEEEEKAARAARKAALNAKWGEGALNATLKRRASGIVMFPPSTDVNAASEQVEKIKLNEALP